MILTAVPNSMKIVNSLAIFVQQKRWRFSVTRLDPVGEQSSLVSFIPKILVKICVSYFLERVYLIGWYQMAVQVHKS